MAKISLTELGEINKLQDDFDFVQVTYNFHALNTFSIVCGNNIGIMKDKDTITFLGQGKTLTEAINVVKDEIADYNSKITPNSAPGEEI